MTVLPNVPRVPAIAYQPVLLNRTLPTVLTRVRSPARINEPAVVQSHFTDHPFRLQDRSRFQRHTVHYNVPHAAHDARIRPGTTPDLYLIPNREFQVTYAFVLALVVDLQGNFVHLVRQVQGVPDAFGFLHRQHVGCGLVGVGELEPHLVVDDADLPVVTGLGFARRHDTQICAAFDI